jgi:hypothetical protein
MKKVFIIVLLISYIFISCEKKYNSPLDLFPDEIKIQGSKSNIEKDSLAVIEGILCDNFSLIVCDYHSGKSFTLFDLEAGEYKGRFGAIGIAPGEIPSGCYGYIEKQTFNISYAPTGLVAKYCLDSLRANISYNPVILIKYKIPDARFSKITPIDDTTFLGAGVYKSAFQYTLFNSSNDVLDFKVNIFNAQDEQFNDFHKFLSNQGVLRKHPSQNKFVYTINNSSNIDFIEISKNNINLIESIRFESPRLKPRQEGMFNIVIPESDNIVGYLDIAAGDNYVYALYTDKKFIDDGGNSQSSNIVLVFDWSGKPVKKYRFDKEIYYIAVNEFSNKLYAAVKEDDGGWNIISYNLQHILDHQTDIFYKYDDPGHFRKTGIMINHFFKGKLY